MPSDKPEPIVLLEYEAAARLGCSEATVKRLRLSGRLEHIPGRPVRIPVAALAAFIKQRAAEAAQKQEDQEKVAQAAMRRRADRYWLKRRLRGR